MSRRTLYLASVGVAPTAEAFPPAPRRHYGTPTNLDRGNRPYTAVGLKSTAVVHRTPADPPIGTRGARRRYDSSGKKSDQ